MCCSVDPVLIYEKVEVREEGFEGAMELFPDTFRPKEIQPEFSGQLKVDKEGGCTYTSTR